jgi:hypothetical protein
VRIPVKEISDYGFTAGRCFGPHKADALANDGRKSIEDIDCWDEPFFDLVIVILRFGEGRELFCKDGKNCIGRITCLGP